MDMAFTHKAQTSNYLKRTYLQQRETPPAHKLTSWQGMELSLEGAPLSKRLSLEASASLPQALSRRRLSRRVCSSCQIAPLLIPDLVPPTLQSWETSYNKSRGFKQWQV